MDNHRNPLFTIDNVLFTVKEKALMVLLVKRAVAPFSGCWGLPGGFIDHQQDADTEATALRKLKEKTSIEPQYLEQLQTFSGHQRDPRGFSITLVYYALTCEQQVSHHIETVDDVRWIELSQLPDMAMAFDHRFIIEQAFERLKQKALYSMIPVFCLPRQFTIGQFKTVIEVIIGQSIQRKSLIRRIEASEMFEAIDEKVQSGGRLAQLYTVKTGVDIVNFERNFRM